MEIITGNKEIIYNEIKELLYTVEHGTIKEKLSAISSIEAILEVVKYIDIRFLDFDHRIITQKYLLEKYEQNRNINCKKFINNFCENKEFHREYIKRIIHVIAKELNDIDDEFINIRTTYMDKNECFDIMYEYFKQYGYEDLFKDFIKNQRVFELPYYLKKNSGLLTYNTVNDKCFMFLERFDNTLKSMFAMVHEMGHVIDFNTIKNKYTTNDKLKLNMLSIYNEVISKFCEKDFLHFLINNNILVDEAKDLLLNYYYSDYDTIFSLYILTVLPDNLLIREKYKQISKEKMFSYLPSNLQKEAEDYLYLLNPDLSDGLNYGYGAIISEFFYNNEKLIEDFYNHRAKPFNYNFLIENDLNALEFKKIYSKKIEKLK